MTTQQTATTESQLDAVLNETNMGSFIASNKGLVFGLLILIIAAIIGQGVYQHQSQNKDTQYQEKINTFESGIFKNFQDKKAKAPEVIMAYKNLVKDVNGFSGLLPTTLLVADELTAEKMVKEAVEVLELGSGTNHQYANFLIKSRLSQAYEDNGEIDKAIGSLTDLIKAQTKLFEGKIYLDLGRLYMKKGNTVKAREHFQYVIDKGVDPEFKKMAKLYLTGLKQK